jgi:type I restriction enzyme S subunit
VTDWRPLKRFCVRIGEYGLNISSDAYAEQGIRLLRTTDISESGGLRDDVAPVFVNRDVVGNLILKPGDLLFSRSGTLGRAYLHATQGEPMTFAGYLVRFVPRDTVDQRYLAYCSQASFFKDQIAAGAVVSTIANFNAERYGELSLPWHGGGYQHQIAEFLDFETAHIDALITKKRHLIELLLARRSSVTVDAVAGKIHGKPAFKGSALPWLDERPSHWKEVLLRLVARLGSGHTPSREHPEWWTDCTIPWITTGEVHRLRSDRVEFIDSTRETISDLGLANSSAELHPADTVVLCRTASAGYSGIMRTPMATSQDFATWTCGPLLRPRFLLLCLRAMRQDLLGRLAMGSTHQTIYMPDIRSIRIPLPLVTEQDEIVEYAWSRLTRMDRQVTIVERQIELLQERRQALITAAVTGELPVPESVR